MEKPKYIKKLVILRSIGVRFRSCIPGSLHTTLIIFTGSKFLKSEKGENTYRISNAVIIQQTQGAERSHENKSYMRWFQKNGTFLDEQNYAENYLTFNIPRSGREQRKKELCVIFRVLSWTYGYQKTEAGLKFIYILEDSLSHIKC